MFPPPGVAISCVVADMPGDGDDRRVQFWGGSTMRVMSGDRRGLRRWRDSLLAVVALAAVSGCGAADDGSVPVGADGYMAVLDDFLPPVPPDGSRPVAYVARLGGEPFPLEDQVAMIEAVEESHDLRFVDDISAAVDEEDADAPPRDDGVLLGIGTIPTAVPHVVRVEVYTAAGLVDAYRVTLTVLDDVWRVVTSDPVDPEVLVGDE